MNNESSPGPRSLRGRILQNRGCSFPSPKSQAPSFHSIRRRRQRRRRSSTRRTGNQTLDPSPPTSPLSPLFLAPKPLFLLSRLPIPRLKWTPRSCSSVLYPRAPPSSRGSPPGPTVTTAESSGSSSPPPLPWRSSSSSSSPPLAPLPPDSGSSSMPGAPGRGSMSSGSMVRAE